MKPDPFQKTLAERRARELKRKEELLSRPKRPPTITPAMQMLYAVRKRANEKGRDFDLTLEWLDENLSAEYCPATGIRFEGNGKDPFGRSIDRKDSSKGYTMDNCWIVCWIYNRCKLDGTHEEVMRFAKAIVKHREYECFL